MQPRNRRTASLLILTCLPACAAAPAEPTAEARAPIVGGVADTFRDYVVGVGDDTGPFCSGSLVSRRTVLTAAHCYRPGMGPEGGVTRVFFGPDLGKPVSTVSTTIAVRHPAFDDLSLSHDLMLLQLAEAAPAQPVPLLRETMTNGPAFIGPSFAFVGYGDDGGQDLHVRRVVTLPIARIGPAGEVGLDTGSGPIDASQLYFRVPHRDTCAGDSGGPALVVRDHVERLAGATSYGDPMCAVDGVDARTDAPSLAAFIQPAIDALEGGDPCRSDGACDENCNAGGALVDPDCAPDHCGADGMCVLSCSDPPDPDCPSTDHCGGDGVCDPGCSPADVDCLTSVHAGQGSSGGGRAAGGGCRAAGGAGNTEGWVWAAVIGWAMTRRRR